MQQQVLLEEIPKRIISLVPSQTELLFDLGLDDRVIGITKFCIYPMEWFESKTRVGGTKNLNIELIRSLKPDLIIGNKEENTKEDIDALKEIAPVWMSDIYDLEDAYLMIHEIGEITGTSEKATRLIQDIKSGFSEIVIPIQKKTALYAIWNEPFYVAGRKTFIDAMISACGFDNFCNEDRYPEWRIDEENQPDYVFLSSEPFPFKEEHLDKFQKLFSKSKVILVDGELFSWYGSRMKLAPNYFQKLLSYS